MDKPKPDAGADRPSWPERVYRELLRFVWGEPATYKDGNVAQIERALCTIRGFAILGLVPVMIYGGISGYCGSHCGPSAGALAVVRELSITLLAAIAAFSVGGMLGFLFGLPRWGDAPQGTLVMQPGHDAPAKERKDGEKPAAAGAPEKPAGNAAPAGARPNRVRPNTGLEKVMDWLTTLIVGLGLVHVRRAIEEAR